MVDALDNAGPFPAIWTYCRYCMDLEKGTFLNWPYEGGFSQNRQVLLLMEIARKAWLYHQIITNPNTKEWPLWCVQFDAAYLTDKPHPIIISAKDKWLSKLSEKTNE